MRNIVTTLYQYDELSDDAKAKARDWFRQCGDGDMFWSESPTEDFLELLKACGWSVHPKRGLQWSGFSSRGDGAAFRGYWYAAECDPTAWLADRPASHVDSEGNTQTCKHNARYHEAAAEIVALAEKYPGGSGSVEHGRSNFIQPGSFHTDDESSDDYALAKELAEAARSLASAFYWNLEAEYDYQNSDEVTAENITVNEYEFTEDGERA